MDASCVFFNPYNTIQENENLRSYRCLFENTEN